MVLELHLLGSAAIISIEAERACPRSASNASAFAASRGAAHATGALNAHEAVLTERTCAIGEIRNITLAGKVGASSVPSVVARIGSLLRTALLA